MRCSIRNKKTSINMLYEKIIPAQGHSFEKREFKLKHFSVHWHHHDEYELVLIVSGKGKRFTGNKVSPFAEGDLLLIGPNIPHFHLCEQIYFETNGLQAESHAIYFNSNVFPANIESGSEFSAIKRLLKDSRGCIKFHTKGLEDPIVDRIQKLSHNNGFKGLLELYDILNTLSEYRYEVLITAEDRPELTAEEMQLPGNKAFQYINKHFKEKVTLSEVAKYAGLTPAALCRRFKQISGKSLFDYLSEVRIEFSYKLLAESTLPISMVAQEAGFQNVSHFNRVFKKLSGVTPKEYKRQHYRKV